MKLPQKIDKRKLLLVEGKDEVSFFNVLLEKNKINEIQVMDTGGKEQFKKLFPIIKNTPGFDELETLAIIHDADKDSQIAFQSVCDVLKNNEIKAPKEESVFISDTLKVGVFIITYKENKGNLEALCLSSIESDSIMECIDSFTDCIKKKKNSNYKTPINIHKAKCRAFLSAMEEDTPSLGVATKKEYWNLDSEKLKPLLDFLKQI